MMITVDFGQFVMSGVVVGALWFMFLFLLHVLGVIKFI